MEACEKDYQGHYLPGSIPPIHVVRLKSKYTEIVFGDSRSRILNCKMVFPCRIRASCRSFIVVILTGPSFGTSTSSLGSS